LTIKDAVNDNNAKQINVYAAGLEVREWAQNRNLMSNEIPSYSQNNSASEVNLKGFSHSESLLRQKQIVNVLVNESASKVIILTKKILAKKDLETLPKFIHKDIRVEYLHAGNAQAGFPPSLATCTPYTITKNGKYACGSSIHPARHIGAGTLGCLVKDSSGKIFGLTNNHVSGNCNFSLSGEKILAPGPVDITAGGIDPFTIGHHYKASTFVAGVPDNIVIDNNCDSALVQIVDNNLVSSMQGDEYDTPDQVTSIQPGTTVYKVGRTTGHTEGLVLGQIVGPFSCTYTIHGLGTQQAYFPAVFMAKGITDKFSDSGDSGSLVTTIDDGVRKAVGLVFAGDTQGLSYILPLDAILKNLGVTLVKGHNI